MSDKKQTASTEREKIVETVKAAAPTISKNLHTFWRRSFQDLVCGGVSRDALIESMFDVAMSECRNVIGTAALVDRLRDSADRVEQIAFAESEARSRPQH